MVDVKGLPVPASAHIPIGYTESSPGCLLLPVPASAHIPIGYTFNQANLGVTAVPASAHIPIGYTGTHNNPLIFNGLLCIFA